jgi:hypothetical protein
VNDLDLNDMPGSDRETDDELAPSSVGHGAKGLALAIALVAIGLGSATALFVHVVPRVTADKPQDCAVLTDADVRLNCYDGSVHRAAPQPARGAMAPSPTLF